MKGSEWLYQVFGLVQGVGYRNSICHFIEKNQLPLRGYVRNREDGSVEILAQGEEGDLTTLLDFCYKGSKFCRVRRVEVEKREVEAGTLLYEDFGVR